MKVRTRGVEETRALAEEVAALLRPGDVVAVCGDLGTGKTAFVQGLGRGLGVPGPVVSPSFVIVREYRGRLPLVHVDVYRLERVQELYDLGFEEVLDPDKVTVVEWGDAVVTLLDPDRLDVRLEPGTADDERMIELVPHGESWTDRQADLAGVTARAAGG